MKLLAIASNGEATCGAQKGYTGKRHEEDRCGRGRVSWFRASRVWMSLRWCTTTNGRITFGIGVASSTVRVLLE